MDHYDLFGSVQGRRIIAMRWDEDRVYLTTDQGEVVWKAEGDCCSCSYIENCNIEPGLVLEVEDMTTDDSRAKDEGENYIKYHSVRVKTTGGWGTIEFRNESNGYYSGFLVVDTRRKRRK